MRESKQKQTDSMRSYRQQLLLYSVLVFCSLAHTKPRIGIESEKTDPNSHFAILSWNNSEPNRGEHGCQGPEATNNQPIKFPDLENPTTNNSLIQFPGPTNQTPVTNSSNGEHREDRCNLPSETGWCRGRFEMWYFDTKSGDCEPFIFGGCNGNGNRFFSKEECRDVCVVKTVSGFP